AGLRAHFTDFAVNAGRVWVHGAELQESDGNVAGPYTGRGLYGDGEFWSGAVLSDTLVVEYLPAPGAALSDEPPFTVAEVSHLVSGYLRGEADKAGGSDPKAAAAPCNLDVSCYSDWSGTASAVAHITFEDSQGSWVCSGTLLNTRNSSRIPYFLTANHCIADD